MRASRAFIPKLAQACCWCAFALLVLLCILSKGSTRVFTWPWAFYAQLLMLAPVVLAGHAQLKSTTTNSSGGAVLFLCAASVGLSVLLSRNPHFSFEAALPLWGGLAFIWWLVCVLREALPSEERIRQCVRVVGFAMLAPLISSVWQWSAGITPTLMNASSLAEAFDVLGRYRNPNPFGHPNYTGGFALVTLPWFIALARVETFRWRMAWVLVVLLDLALLFSSGSRGALLGMLAMVAGALLIGVMTRQISRQQALWSLMGGAMLVIALGATNARVRSLLTEPSGLRYPNVGDVQRLGMLQGGILLGQQRPWVGHGPGMVPFVYPEVRAQLVGGVETSYQLHNAYLHVWVTVGAIGMAAGLGLAWWLLCGTRRWLRQPPGMARTFALASAIALASYAVMAVTDYQLDVIGIIAALCVPGSLLLAAPRPDSKASAPVRVSLFNVQSRAFRVTFGSLLLSAAVMAVVVLVPHWRARQLHWRAWVETPVNERTALVSKLLTASNTAPWNTHYRNQLGLELTRGALESNQAEQRRLARDVFFSSLARDPAQEPIHANLGWLWLPDNPNYAGVEFRRALVLLPDRETLHYGLAISCLKTGDERGAIQALALECLVNPPFLVSPHWAEADLRKIQREVVNQLKELLKQTSAHPMLPKWRQRDLGYFSACLRWWEEGAIPVGEELAGASEPQRLFFTALASGVSDRSSWPLPWRELVPERGQPGAFIVPASDNPAIREAIEVRQRAGAATLADLIRSSARVDTTTALGMERSHYSLMHRNLDGPGYLDLAPRYVDVFCQRYAEPLFPPRGLVPGPVLKYLARVMDNASPR
jgi:hypothetical protein